MSLRSKEEILAVIQRYTWNVTALALSEEEILEGHVVPDVWRQLLRNQAAGKKTLPLLWQGYTDILPETIAFLREKVKGVAVLLTQDQPPLLLYVYGKGAKTYLYKGLPPVTQRPGTASTLFWQGMPARLRDFYMQVHNGWVQYASDAIGPLPLESVVPLSDPDFDISPDLEARLPFHLDRVFAVFSNGGGDYLAIDCDKGPDATVDGVLWWHETPLESEVNLDFWAYMDGWISGQVEEMDAA